IVALFHYHKGRYGYRRITLALRNEGHVINHKTVRKLMREQQLSSNLRAKKYNSYKGIYGKTAPDVLQRDFTADKPGQKWVTDVTEFRVGNKKLYLSLVAKMLDDALEGLRSGDGLVLHSDQGWQYQMAVYQEKLSSKGLTQSMSRKGNCLDNAVMENFFGILKSECWHCEEY
ncbi:IS3 family transposase, partial [Erwinia mallotivora]|uniref:IS3 family transposase n=1 Tax=Erwinia mallotivora TaxID=69222 RepID=UPI0035E4F390